MKRTFSLGRKKQKGYSGGVLLSVLVLFTLFNALFFLVLEDYKHQEDMFQLTKNYYQSKIIETMAETTLEQLSEEGLSAVTSGNLVYSYGEVIIFQSEKKNFMEIKLNSGMQYVKEVK